MFVSPIGPVSEASRVVRSKKSKKASETETAEPVQLQAVPSRRKPATREDPSFYDSAASRSSWGVQTALIGLASKD